MLIDAARELGDSVGEAISAHAADVDNVPMDDLLQKSRTMSMRTGSNVIKGRSYDILCGIPGKSQLTIDKILKSDIISI